MQRLGRVATEGLHAVRRPRHGPADSLQLRLQIGISLIQRRATLPRPTVVRLAEEQRLRGQGDEVAA
jgi:hypothetical protein